MDDGEEELLPASANQSPGRSRIDVNCSSSFRPNSHNFVSGSDIGVLGLVAGETLCFLGACLLRVVRGAVALQGQLLQASPTYVEVFSPNSHALLTITAIAIKENADKSSKKRKNEEAVTDYEPQVSALLSQLSLDDFDTLICLRSFNMERFSNLSSITPFQNLFSLPSSASSSSVYENFVQILPQADFHPIYEPHSGLNALLIPDIWTRALSAIFEFSATDSAPRILICGGKNVGKSTFSRVLANAMLQRYGTVAYLETDPGQCEFTPPGIIALNIVTQPIFGPSFTHFTKPERAVFLGATSPKHDSDQYLNAIRQLMTVYANFTAESPMPLIINTPGWIKGAGLDLLHDVCEIIRPAQVLQMSDRRKASQFDLSLPPDTIIHSLISEFESNNNGTFTATDHRNLALAVYFRTTAELLRSRPPYAVRWGEIGVSFLHCEVSVEACLFALNSTLVGLIADTSEAYKKAPQIFSAADGEFDCPRLVASTSATMQSCVGLGIIRDVDVENRVFHIVTPVDPTLLQSVTLIVRGAGMELPIQFFSQDGFEEAPYLVLTQQLDGIGAGSRRPRHNLLRRGQATK